MFNLVFLVYIILDFILYNFYYCKLTYSSTQFRCVFSQITETTNAYSALLHNSLESKLYDEHRRSNNRNTK